VHDDERVVKETVHTEAECGVVYGVSGLPWLRETLISAASVRTQMPGVCIDLHIDQETCDKASEFVNIDDFFDLVCRYDKFDHWRSPKFSALQAMRFERCLYLDGDTYVTDRIDELFEALDRFDIAIMPAPQRISRHSIEVGLLDILPPVPACFTEYNGGVIAYRRSDSMRLFFQEWMRLHELGMREKEFMMDQAAFRASLYYSELRILALWPEYNLRFGVPNIVKDRVKIVHAHGDLAAIARQVNSEAGKMRITRPVAQLFEGRQSRHAYVDDNTSQALKQDLLDTVARLRQQLGMDS
jgi:hypothetical protein